MTAQLPLKCEFGIFDFQNCGIQDRSDSHAENIFFENNQQIKTGCANPGTGDLETGALPESNGDGKYCFADGL